MMEPPPHAGNVVPDNQTPDRSMRRFLVAIVLLLLLAVSIGIGVAASRWPALLQCWRGGHPG